MRNSAILISLGILLIGNACSATDALKLDTSNSVLTFTSTKNGSITEIHSWHQISGSYADGQAVLTLPTSGIDTGIDIRNKRMREMLFSGIESLKVEAQAAMPSADTQRRSDAQVLLSVGGQEITQTIPVSVVQGADGRFVVTAVQPFLIDANALKLSAGLQALQEIAGLSQISPSVVVDFHLEFTP